MDDSCGILAPSSVDDIRAGSSVRDADIGVIGRLVGRSSLSRFDFNFGQFQPGSLAGSSIHCDHAFELAYFVELR